jgi:hypothetical protein
VVVDKKKPDLNNYLFSTVEIEVDSPDLWIAYTGTTVDMTTNKDKLINFKNQITSNVITMRNGIQELVPISAKVVGAVNRKNEDKVMKIQEFKIW